MPFSRQVHCLSIIQREVRQMKNINIIPGSLSILSLFVGLPVYQQIINFMLFVLKVILGIIVISLFICYLQEVEEH